MPRKVHGIQPDNARNGLNARSPSSATKSIVVEAKTDGLTQLQLCLVRDEGIFGNPSITYSRRPGTQGVISRRAKFLGERCTWQSDPEDR